MIVEGRIILNKEKIFFIASSFVLIMAVTIYSVYSDKPNDRPVVSTYISYRNVETITVTAETEKSEIMIKYPIDINFATKEELCSLDGIGDALSDRIIKYRNNNYFYSIEEITNVNGIGEKFLDENRNKIFVDVSRLPEVSTTYSDITTNASTITAETHKTETITAYTQVETTVSETVAVTAAETAETRKEITPVNLNTATYEELISLPIPPEIAEQILEKRKKTGCFSSTEELCYIESFNRELYRELIEYVYVE